MTASRVSYCFRFIGKVQGVGFRNTVLKLSKHRQVYGYVKNLSTGDVELRVEGSEAEIHSFLEDIKEVMRSNISSVHKEACEVGAFSKFKIMK